jgi:hypothetical protein
VARPGKQAVKNRGPAPTSLRHAGGEAGDDLPGCHQEQQDPQRRDDQSCQLVEQQDGEQSEVVVPVVAGRTWPFSCLTRAG